MLLACNKLNELGRFALRAPRIVQRACAVVEFPEGFEVSCSHSSELEKVIASICNAKRSRKR
jgi:hypothetical protein